MAISSLLATNASTKREHTAARWSIDLPVVDPLHHLHVGRGVADLEPDGQAHLAVRLRAQLHDLLAARHVHAHRLLEVGVLAGGDGGFQVVGVEVRRAGDVDGVHVLAGEELLVGLGPGEDAGEVDRRFVELGGDLVEPFLGLDRLALEDVAEAGDDDASVLDEGRGHTRAPTAAAEEAQAHGRVPLRAPDQLRLDDHGAGGGGGTDELAAADLGVRLVAHALLLSDRGFRRFPRACEAVWKSSVLDPALCVVSRGASEGCRCHSIPPCSPFGQHIRGGLARSRIPAMTWVRPPRSANPRPPGPFVLRDPRAHPAGRSTKRPDEAHLHRPGIDGPQEP